MPGVKWSKPSYHCASKSTMYAKGALLNARSVKNKEDYFKDYTIDNNLDFLALTETSTDLAWFWQ
jgi:hypothetical protein